MISIFSVGLMMLLFMVLANTVSGADPDTPKGSGTDLQKLNIWAASHVQVSNFSLDPPILMPGDIATVTLVLENTMSTTSNVPVIISAAEMKSDDLKVLTNVFDKVGTINPGTKVPLTFSFKAGPKEGVFYPFFTASFLGAHFLKFPFPVVVEANPIDISLYDAPDTWIEGKKGAVILNVANMRKNVVNRVEVTPEQGNGNEILPVSHLIGSIGPDTVIQLPFNITPHGNSHVNFSIRYYNGENPHNASYSIPFVIGISKQQANVTVSRADVSLDGDHILLKGDVYNAGLQTANAVIVSVKDPAVPIYPYKQYGVGILKPSDFASFQMTFITEPGVKSVTLTITYKDTDGRIISSEIPVDLSDVVISDNSTGMQNLTSEVVSNPSVLDRNLLIGIVLILFVTIGVGLVIHRRRRFS